VGFLIAINLLFYLFFSRTVFSRVRPVFGHGRQ
jgi:hypothetical protein